MFQSVGRQLLATMALLVAPLLHAANAYAAGSAYAVDTAEVGEPGNCKVETWLSWADNRDYIASMTPACVIDLGRPVDISAQISRTRTSGDLATSLSPKLKTNFVPTAIGKWGIALSGTATLDARTGEAASLAVAVPATLRLSERMRINLNAGWMLDRVLGKHFLIYGAGFDWIVGGPWTVTAEIFGQAGPGGLGTFTRPRAQAGLRFRPADALSLDLIYGRNIAGENANWLTLAMTIRFPAPTR